MSRNLFFGNNKTINEFVYQTNISSATTTNFRLSLPSTNIKKRVYYGPNYNGFNFFIQPPYESVGPYFNQRILFTYSGDPGYVKTVRVKSDDLTKIIYINGDNQKIYGNLDLTPLKGLNQISFTNNPNLTGITHTLLNNVQSYNFESCNIIGTHDVRMLPNLSNFFMVHQNPNLTKILHTGSTGGWFQYYAYDCNLTGNHDISMLNGSSGVGMFFFIHNNVNLTGITHATTTQPFTYYYAYNCNLTGNHDVSMLSGLGGEFRINLNPNLKNVTHSLNLNEFSLYDVSYCDITNNFDVSMLTDLAGWFEASNNPNLTGITHTTASKPISNYNVYNCNLMGTHDISMLTGLGQPTLYYPNTQIRLDNNPNLKTIIFPILTGGTFLVKEIPYGIYALEFSECSSMEYVNFWPLSGSVMQTSGINLYNNNITATNINHILVDLDTITTLNQPNWTGVTLNIGGNSYPDSSSGGYDGITALNNLTGSPKNWIIYL